ncbi:MAG: pyridoxal phosphate-dependent aminotransferase [Phycisphaerae bacterium]|nr:pyridoxal phosphate-dependent aminotransferase [Phycisphaerae bacterium]
MSLSKIAKSLSQSATLKLNETAATLRAQGVPVIHLGGGEPQSKAPADALTAASKLLATGEVRYAPASGIPALKQAVLKYTAEFYHHEVEPKNVIISSGAKQSLMVALQVTLDPGDEVIFPTPYWVSYPDMVKLCGAVPVAVTPKEHPFYPRISDIEAHTTPRTKAVIINSPNNPSGAMYSAEFIGDVVRFCEERGLYLIMDDIYHRLIFDGLKPISCYDFTKDLGDESRLIVINGVSKQYAMTGFRIGWAVGARPLISVMGNAQGHQTSGASTLSQHAALGALTGPQESVEELRSTLEKNRDALITRLSAIPNIRVPKPDGTFYSFADFSAYDTDSVRMAQFLLEKANVVTVPGDAFGLDGYLRISFCGAMQDIVEGVDRIKAALATMPANK